MAKERKYMAFVKYKTWYTSNTAIGTASYHSFPLCTAVRVTLCDFYIMKVKVKFSVWNAKDYSTVKQVILAPVL